MKKILCGLLACALFMTALAGCSKSAPSDTVKWFNATYAILTTANEADVNEIGGYKKNSVNEVLVQAVLEDSWGVTDRPLPTRPWTGFSPTATASPSRTTWLPWKSWASLSSPTATQKRSL